MYVSRSPGAIPALTKAFGSAVVPPTCSMMLARRVSISALVTLIFNSSPRARSSLLSKWKRSCERLSVSPVSNCICDVSTFARSARIESILPCTVAWVIFVSPTVAAAPTCEHPVNKSAVAAIIARNFFTMSSLSVLRLVG